MSLILAVGLGSPSAMAHPRKKGDVYGCIASAVRAAIEDAESHLPYTEELTEIRYSSITSIEPSIHTESTVYEVNLLQRNEEASFGLTYMVTMHGKKPYCETVQVDLIGQEQQL